MQKNYSDLPNLDSEIKNAVKLGNVALYAQKSDVGGNSGVKYILHIMNNVNYYLDENGKIIGMSSSDDFDKTDLVLFAE
ncbi:MAG: hypothetical protein LBG89_00845 [Rickettsiales bacterium]|jgi:hypothetical protein|nr:hypothetical protein [Rickettsiales bacterium]